MPSKGLLVGIEGIDATGKKTQTLLLDSWLRSNKVKATALSFPDYTTKIGLEIKGFLLGTRKYPLEVGHMLFAANRWERKADLEGLLKENAVVIVNRYTESNLAYGVANKLPLKWLTNLEVGLPKTDLVLVLDAPPAIAYPRRSKDKDRYENDFGLQENARNAYLDLAEQFGWNVIDAAQDIDKTNLLVTSAVAKLLSSKGRNVQEGTK